MSTRAELIEYTKTRMANLNNAISDWDNKGQDKQEQYVVHVDGSPLLIEINANRVISAKAALPEQATTFSKRDAENIIKSCRPRNGLILKVVHWRDSLASAWNRERDFLQLCEGD